MYKLKGIYLSKALTCMIFSCINKNAYLASTACLSVFLESLPGLIPFANCDTLGEFRKKNSCMNINYNYPTTIVRSIFAQNVQISGRKIYIYIFQGQNEKL